MLSLVSGAGNEARTRDLNLGKVALYQLSYSRKNELRIIGVLGFVSMILPQKFYPIACNPNRRRKFSVVHRPTSSTSMPRNTAISSATCLT